MWSDQRCFLKAVGKRAMYLFSPLNLYPCGWYLGKITSWILFCTMVFCGVWDEWFLAWSVPGCLTLTNDGYHFGLEGMLWVAEILEENAISTSTYFLPFFEFPGNNFLINCHYECWVAFREAPSCTRWIYFPCLDEFQCGQLLCMGRLKMISNSTIVIFWYISGLGEPVFYFFFYSIQVFIWCKRFFSIHIS